MKQTSILLIAFVCMLIPATSWADTKISPSELPTQAKAFIKKYFPKQTITYAEKDTELIGTSYEAHLNNGAEISFDRKGVWDKVEFKAQGVPAALVPQTIATYVKANYPDAKIIKIDKERYGYEIELDNDLNLRFNKKGNFIGFDD